MSGVDRDCPAAPATGAPLAQRRAGGGSARTARRRAREFALQGLYGWLLSAGDSAAIASQLKTSHRYDQADEAYFLELLPCTIDAAPALRAQFSDAIDRPV